jgi:hypothetical protein
MDNKNYNTLDSEYDLVHIISKGGDIFAVYDNSDIAFVKYINLIYHDLEIMKKIGANNIVNQINDYKLISLIKNSDIILNHFYLSFEDFIIIDQNSNLLDLNFLDNKIRLYILNKIISIKQSLCINRITLEADPITTLEADPITTLEADPINTLETDSINTLETDSINTLEADTITTLEADTITTLEADQLKDKIEKLENIQKLQISINKEKPSIEDEKEEYIEDFSKNRRDIEEKIRDLKNQKEKLSEKKNIFEVDTKIYNTLKDNLKTDENFIIPELFIRKFEIFKLMDDAGDISFIEYLKYNPFKMNISISSDLNQVFSTDENIAYLTEESDYSDSSVDGDSTDEDVIKEIVN